MPCRKLGWTEKTPSSLRKDLRNILLTRLLQILKSRTSIYKTNHKDNHNDKHKENGEHGVKDNCDHWIKYAYKNWLKNWIRTLQGNEYLSEAAQNMVDRMKDASDKGQTEEAWNLMERLKRMSGSFYGTSENHDLNYHDQWAEIYMECALVAYELGDLTEASKLLHNSTGNFYGHQTLQKAIVYWFLGCIQWQLPAHSEEAVVSWERAMKIIKGAASSDKEEMCNGLRADAPGNRCCHIARFFQPRRLRNHPLLRRQIRKVKRRGLVLTIRLPA